MQHIKFSISRYYHTFFWFVKSFMSALKRCSQRTTSFLQMHPAFFLVILPTGRWFFFPSLILGQNTSYTFLQPQDKHHLIWEFSGPFRILLSSRHPMLSMLRALQLTVYFTTSIICLAYIMCPIPAQWMNEWINMKLTSTRFKSSSPILITQIP